MESSVGFDFWLPDASLGGFCRLARGGGFVAGLVGEGRPYLLVKDLDVRPRSGTWEVRAEGLWADFNQEDPEGLHWSWGLEAFGVAFDDPADALGAEWGERTALGFDLEWEGPSIVHGDILVGPSERIAFDGAGRRWLDLPTQPTSEQQRGRHAPVRLQAGVLNQWLVGGDEGWVREWASDAAGAGTA
jgi:hypothetical protein